MSELRQDPLTKQWVGIAPDRGKRPRAKSNGDEKKESDFCPFCPGQEHETPPEIFAVRSLWQRDASGWQVRVVPNKFPIFQIEGKLNRKAEGPYRKMNGIGAHEVIIESPDHSQHLHHVSFDQARLILKTAKERMIDLEKDVRFRYLLLFENFGSEAGASLKHPHLQLNAFPIIPFEPTLELGTCSEYFKETESCLLCDIGDYESQISSRIVVESLHLIAFCPFASRFPYEIMIMPKSDSHKAFFTEIDDLELNDLVQVLQITLKKLEAALSYYSPYNLVLHMAPFFRDDPKRQSGETIGKDYHWHLHIWPRLTKIAGFELGAEFYIHPVYPELAAKNLRETAV